MITSGRNTDPHNEYEISIQEMLKIPWGKNSVRLALPIGNKVNNNDLMMFTEDRFNIFSPCNLEKLAHYIIDLFYPKGIAISSKKNLKDEDIKYTVEKDNNSISDYENVIW